MLQVRDYRLQVLQLVVYCLFSIVFLSCGENKFPGFLETSNGLYYKILGIGDGNRNAEVGDVVTARIIIKSEKDSILFDTKSFGLDGAVTFTLKEPQCKKDYTEGFQFLSEGDSATFITDAYTLFMKINNKTIPSGMNLESIIRIDAKLLKLKTPEEQQKFLEEEKKRIEMAEFEEKKILEKYISDRNIVAKPIANGIHYMKIQEGKGNPIDSGSVAVINYRGYFLNGKLFDSTYDTQPFEYVVVGEEQLIRGLEIGLRRMHEGEKAKFIIPSHLAFGSNGSSTEIVPPFTTVIYEVELLKVQ